MKRLLLTSLVALTALNAGAKDVLSEFRASIEGRLVSLSASFSSSQGKGAFDLDTQDGAYRFITKEGGSLVLDIFSDSKTIWILDRNSKECEIETLEEEGDGFVGSIMNIINGVDSHFTVSGTRQAVFEGKKASAVVLEALQGKDGICKEVTLYLQDQRLLGFTSTAGDGTITKFTISRYEVKDKVPATHFTFDESTLDKSWVITDLR